MPPPQHASKDINENKESHPNHIHEVPVPRARLKAKVIFRREVAAKHPHEAHEQHEGAQGHVETVKTRQDEEGRPVDAGLKGQPQRLVGVDIFLHLEEQEDDPEQHREAQPTG